MTEFVGRASFERQRGALAMALFKLLAPERTAQTSTTGLPRLPYKRRGFPPGIGKVSGGSRCAE
jgi:hypothetical protein